MGRRVFFAQGAVTATRGFAASAMAMLLTAAAGLPAADEPVDARRLYVELDREMQVIKSEILAINREILALQEASAYPPARQLVVMVTVSEQSSTAPARVTVKLDGELLDDHAYSPGEREALLNGGVHRLHTGAVEDGEHRLEVVFTGAGVDGQTVTVASGATIDKAPGRAFLELRLSSRQEGREPVLTIHQWR